MKLSRFRQLVFTASAALCLFGSTVHAQVPQLINYQGRVAVSGTNFSGSGQFKFALVSGSAPNVTYWSNDGTSTAGSAPASAVSLTVANGLYSVLLGDTTVANMTEVPATVFANSDVRLRVWLNDGTHGWQQLTPDQRIAAVGYALVAKTASYDDLTNKPTLGSAAALNTGTGAGTVAAGNDSRFSGVNEATQIALDGKATSAQGEKAETALQPTDSGSGLSNVTPKYQALPNLSTKLSATGARQFRIGLCGDSFMANADLSTPLKKLLGVAGYHMVNATISGSTIANSYDYSNWFQGYTRTLVKAGDTAMFTNNFGTAFPMNTIHYYVVTTPTSGTVKLQYSLNGTGAWTDMTAEISCASTDTASIVIPGTLPALASYQTRIISVSGSATVIGALGYDSTATGVIIGEFARGGNHVNQFGATIPAAVITPILTDLAMDTMIWKTAIAPTILPTYAENFFALFNNIKAADWVIVTPHPEADPELDAQYVQDNAYLRSLANAHHYFLLDSYSLFGSSADLNARFGAGDTIHLSANADKYWVSALLGTGIFNAGFVNALNLTGVIPNTQLSAFRDVNSLPNWEVGLTSSNKINWSFQPADGASASILFKNSAGNPKAEIIKFSTSQAYYPNALEFRGYQSPNGVMMFMETGKVWIGTSRPTSTPTDDFHVEGNASITGSLKLTGSSTAPANTTTPVAWRDVVISGATYKIPLYQ